MSLFTGRDANKDGKLTADELAGNPMTERMMQLDKDGDKDWVGTSMIWGPVIIVERVEPDSGPVLALEDVDVSGEYHVVAALYVEGGGRFQPESGVDFMANSEKVMLGEGKVEVTLELDLAP